MFAEFQNVLPLLVVLALFLLLEAFILAYEFQLKWEKAEKGLERKIYEANVLRELSQRFGYELSPQKIIEMIISSLKGLFPYSVAAYFLRTDDPAKVIFKACLEEGVKTDFLEILKKSMRQAFGGEFTLEEEVTGTIFNEKGPSMPTSSFYLPVIIAGQTVGLLAIASSKPGFYREEERIVLEKILTNASDAFFRLQKVLATEKGKLSATVESLSDGIVVLDNENALVIFNPAAKTLLGLEKMEKATIFDLTNALSGKLDLKTKIEEAREKNNVVQIKDIILEDKYSEIFISPVHDEEGKILGTVILFHDITAEKELAKIREEFTAMMVHELRAPLTVVRGTADTLISHPEIGGQEIGRRLLESMKTSSQTMISLVNDLLDVAKIEAGKFQIMALKQNMKEVIENEVVFFGQLAQEKQIKLVAEVPDGLPDIQFDKDKITQVLNNLISNSLKFTPCGGVITLKAGQKTEPAEIVVSVTDTGGGIPADKLPQLFSKFKQLGSTATAGEKGTGLGLVIVKGIVEAHKGKVWVESAAGQGTTVYFTLPL